MTLHEPGNESSRADPEGYGSKEGGAGSKPGFSDTMDKAKETVRQFAEELRDDASQKAKSVLSGTRESFAEDLETLAHSMRQAAQSLEDRDSRVVAGYAHTAAESVEKLADYLQEKDFGHIVDDVEDFARDKPMLFLGGAFAAGFLLARLLKSSAQAFEQRNTRPREYERHFSMETHTGNGEDYSH